MHEARLASGYLLGSSEELIRWLREFKSRQIAAKNYAHHMLAIFRALRTSTSSLFLIQADANGFCQRDFFSLKILLNLPIFWRSMRILFQTQVLHEDSSLNKYTFQLDRHIVERRSQAD